MTTVLPRLLPLLLLAGCLGGGRQLRDVVARPLQDANQGLEARADPTALDRAITQLERLARKHPEDARVLGALTRGLTHRGYGYPDDDRPDLRRAKEVGLRCLQISPEFGAALAATGFELRAGAVAHVEASHSECLVWTTHAWLRWHQARGVGGATFDLPALQAMSQRGKELSTGTDYTVATINEALAWGLASRADDSDPVRVERALSEALDREPARLDLAVERAELVSAALGQEEAWRGSLKLVLLSSIDAQGPWAMENRRAQQRARAALEGLSPKAAVRADQHLRSSSKAPAPDAPEEGR